MTTLYVDDSGNLWILDGESSRPLGPACDERYHDVEPALWPELARLIADAEDARGFGEGCRAEVDESWLRLKGAR